jgi:hypothetical protein
MHIGYADTPPALCRYDLISNWNWVATLDLPVILSYQGISTHRSKVGFDANAVILSTAHPGIRPRDTGLLLPSSPHSL